MINLTVDRVLEMDSRELYDVADLYLKGRFSRFALHPEDEQLLEERELPVEDRSDEYNEVWPQYKSAIRDVLYDPEVIVSYRSALQRTESAVEKQLDNADGGNPSWERGARGFLNMVRDEISRVQIAFEDMFGFSEAEHHRDILLKAIEEHQNAEDVEAADEHLWTIAEQIREELET